MPIPDVDAVRDALVRCGPELHAPLPELAGADVARLAAGEVVRVVRHGDPSSPSTAVGYAVLDGSIGSLWLAAQDPHTNVDEALTEFVLGDAPNGEVFWYGHLDLPAPITDRQWVVASGNNRAAAERGCWEHYWALAADELPRAREALEAGRAPGLSPDVIDDAVVTPVNHGAWFLTSLGPDKTLVAYQATSVVGGAIPDWLVLKLTTARLESVLRNLETLGRDWVPGHYGPAHTPVRGPDGRALPPFG